MNRIVRSLAPRPQTQMIAAIGVVLIFVAGATIGANAAAAGEQQPELRQEVIDNAISDGELQKPPEEATKELHKPMGFDRIFESRTARQLLAPLFHVALIPAVIGNGAGFWSVNAIGAPATQGWLHGTVLLALGAVVYRVQRVLRRR